MLIGSETNYIRLDKASADWPGLVWRFEAGCIGVGWSFHAEHDRVVPDASNGTKHQSFEFANGRASRTEIGLSDGGWLRLKRDPAGSLLVRYRVGHLDARGAIEGEIVLERQAADEFCQFLKTLF